MRPRPPALDPGAPVKPRSPARKAIVLFAALAVAGLALWVMTRQPVISGTKSTFSAVATRSTPGGVAVTTTTGTTGQTTTTPAKTTSTTSIPPAAGGR